MQKYAVMRFNMFNRGSSFNMQQLVAHNDDLCKQWRIYAQDEQITSERVGGSFAYEAARL